MDMGHIGRSADDQRWLQMLASLAPMSLLLAVKDAEARWASAVSDYKPRDSIRNSVCVEILERLSPTSIVVSWADATSGRYGEQTWTLRSARRKGVCSLSGEPFTRGHAGLSPERAARQCDQHQSVDFGRCDRTPGKRGTCSPNRGCSACQAAWLSAIEWTCWWIACGAHFRRSPHALPDRN